MLGDWRMLGSHLGQHIPLSLEEHYAGVKFSGASDGGFTKICTLKNVPLYGIILQGIIYFP